jgi:energy-coupling factor transporter transmembrane protein EcfT
MRKKNLVITPIFITILSLTLLVFIAIINHFIYHGVLNSSLYFVYYFIIIISYLLPKKKLYKFVPIILIIIVTLLFGINRPNFTYKQAIEIIQNEENSEHIDIDTSNIVLLNSPNIFINRAYFIDMKKDGQVVKYVFNPINGKYSIFNLH